MNFKAWNYRLKKSLKKNFFGELLLKGGLFDDSLYYLFIGCFVTNNQRKKFLDIINIKYLKK